VFFSEEKNQKTFGPCPGRTIPDLAGDVAPEGLKVFCFFFSKKKAFSHFAAVRMSFRCGDNAWLRTIVKPRVGEVGQMEGFQSAAKFATVEFNSLQRICGAKISGRTGRN